MFTEETLLFAATSRTRVPEVDVPHTSSCESRGSWDSIPADVVDLVGITLLLEDGVSCLIIDVNLMFVVEIDSSDHALTVERDSDDTTSALGDLNSLLLLTSACVPFENGGAGADLAGDGGLAFGAESYAHNVISVVVRVVGDVLGSAGNLATTEELLGVGWDVQDDTEGGSHVDSVALLVPVGVLLGVGTSVAVHVLKRVGRLGLRVVNLVVAIRLGDLADPGAQSHELLASRLLNGEEVVLTTILVLAFVAGVSLAGLFVDFSSALAVHVHFGVVVVDAVVFGRVGAWGTSIGSTG